MQPGSLRGQEGQETGCPQGQAFRKDIVIQMKRALSLSTYLFGPVILISSHLQAHSDPAPISQLFIQFTHL